MTAPNWSLWSRERQHEYLMKNNKWRRYRFHANEDDPRPVVFPPPGPWWCSGTGDDYSIVIAYLPPKEKLTRYWPEATQVDFTEETEITFTDRFPKPDWWKE